MFSGFETLIKSKKWDPSGAPSIYKLIEKMSVNKENIEIVFTCKTDTDEIKKPYTIKAKGLAKKIYIIPFFKFYNNYRINNYYTEIRHFLLILIKVIKYKPDIIYIDNANIFTGALLARFTRKKVLLRLMGVYPFMKKCIKGNNFKNLYLRWCYSAPYFASISVLDGSGGMDFMKKALNKKTIKKLVLNGVDKLKIIESNRKKTTILFVGKFEDYKGIMIFVKTMVKLIKNEPNKFKFILIGNGSKSFLVENIINKECIANYVTIYAREKHKNILKIYNKADIYVSLNMYGNLSNTNIEAIKMGKCVIIPTSNSLNYIDLDTDIIIPKDSVIRIDRKNLEIELYKKLNFLSNNPDIIKTKKNNARKLAKNIFWSWNDRINWEIHTLHEFKNKKNFTSSKNEVEIVEVVEKLKV